MFSQESALMIALTILTVIMDPSVSLLRASTDQFLDISDEINQFRVSSLDLSFLYTVISALDARLLEQIPRIIQCPWYIKPRSIEWFIWYIEDIPFTDPVRFKQFFRVSPATFTYICDLLRDSLTRNPPPGLRTLPNRLLTVERQVAVSLRRYATGDLFLSLGELFGLAECTVAKIVWRFTKAMCEKGRMHLKWPREAEMEHVKEGFHRHKRFPNCCGAIDATHILVELPPGANSTAYKDYKRGTSVSVQAIVDHEMRFLDVFAGWPGSIHDSRLLRNSGFYSHVEFLRCKLDGPKYTLRTGDEIGEYIIGDAGYPAFPWLILPYPGASERKLEFNYLHSASRMIVERAFGRLKGTWRLFARIVFRPDVNKLGSMIYTACILHNILLDRADPVDHEVWAHQRGHANGYNGQVPYNNRRMFATARSARDSLMEELLPQTEWEVTREEHIRQRAARQAARQEE